MRMSIRILYCLFEKKLSVSQTEEITKIEKTAIQKINQLIINSEHKRLPVMEIDVQKK